MSWPTLVVGKLSHCLCYQVLYWLLHSWLANMVHGMGRVSANSTCCFGMGWPHSLCFVRGTSPGRSKSNCLNWTFLLQYFFYVFLLGLCSPTVCINYCTFLTVYFLVWTSQEAYTEAFWKIWSAFSLWSIYKFSAYAEFIRGWVMSLGGQQKALTFVTSWKLDV